MAINVVAVSVDGSALLFHRVPESKIVKNRVHLDLATTDYEAETDRLIKLGAVRLHNLDIKQGGSRWRTFADPEGNEFDLVATTWLTAMLGVVSAASRRGTRPVD